MFHALTQLKKVQVEADESVEYSIYCTSTLIDRQHILLAGHCVKAPEPNATHIFVYGYSDLTVDASNYATKSKNFAELSDVKQNPYVRQFSLSPNFTLILVLSIPKLL